MFDTLAQAFLDHGIVAFLLLLIIALILLLLDEDRAALWRGRAFKAALALTGRRDHEKRYIANDLRGRLNLARRKLHHAISTLPQAVSVEWVDVETSQTYTMRDGQYIVKLNPANEQNVNIVRLTEAMVQRTTLSGLRHVTAPGLQQAIDLTMVRKLLHQVGSKEALDYFLGGIYKPLRSSNDEFRRWDEKIVQIDEQGLYERLLLVELEAFSRRIAPLPPRPYMLGELENLVSFIYRIATKKEGEDVPLQYIKAHLRVGVVLVAKTEKLLREGVGPYVASVQFHLRSADTIYVIIWHKEWLRGGFFLDQYNRFASQLSEQMRNMPQLKQDFTVGYRYTDPRGRPGSGVISRYVKLITDPGN